MTRSSTERRPLVPLGPLLAEVQVARNELADQRGARIGAQPDVTAARTRLLAALEVLALALNAAGRPMPYRLRDELFLCREISKRRAY